MSDAQVRKALEQMVADGAAINYPWMGVDAAALAAVRWEPGWLVWAILGVEDQSGLHRVPYDTIEQIHDKGIKLSAQGIRTAYIAPLAEWDWDAHEDHATLLAARDRALADPKQRERFMEFFTNGI